MSVSIGKSVSRGTSVSRETNGSVSVIETDDFASYLVQEVDGTSRFQLEDDTGALILE